MIYRSLYNWPPFRWKNPFEELNQMKRSMDRLLGQLSGGFQPDARVGVFPLINLTETKDGYHIRAELPGVQSKELDIQATDKTISISGERKIEPEKNNVKYHRREREAGKFSRIITLPGDIDPAKVEAKLANGVLDLSIPKAEKTLPKKISVL